MKKKKNKVAVAMSGGVDSSVAAKLLVDKGFAVTGFFLHFWKDEEAFLKNNLENKCCSTKALMDARRVAAKIGISFYTMDLSRQFKKYVVDYFISEYKNGQTPNPCVRCNKSVKIGLLINKIKELGYDYLATGHYAKISSQKKSEKGNLGKLLKAKDQEKDQGYFLYTLSQEELGSLLFPLGGYTKEEVRKMAKKWGLPVAKKKESQEICFIAGKDHNDFLKKHIKPKPGPIKLLPEFGKKSAKIIGQHQGLPFYTIGQRRGIELGGGGPYYVAKTDYRTNTLFVVNSADNSVLFKDELTAKEVNWISGFEPKLPLRCRAMIRYRHQPVICRVDNLKSRSGRYEVKFARPQRAITSGQSVVFYQRNEILGGGVIV